MLGNMPQTLPAPPNVPTQPVHAPVAQQTAPAPVVASSSARAQSPQSDGEKIPRPANAWIMYRKHHHASFVTANPGVHNNQICNVPAPIHWSTKLTCSSWIDLDQMAR